MVASSRRFQTSTGCSPSPTLTEILLTIAFERAQPTGLQRHPTRAGAMSLRRASMRRSLSASAGSTPFVLPVENKVSRPLWRKRLITRNVTRRAPLAGELRGPPAGLFERRRGGKAGLAGVAAQRPGQGAARRWPSRGTARRGAGVARAERRQQLVARLNESRTRSRAARVGMGFFACRKAVAMMSSVV